MKLHIGRFCLALFVVISLGALHGDAQSTAALKGKWTFTASVPGLGSFPVPLIVKPNGHGSADFEGFPVSLPIVYREDGLLFSVTVEVPAEFSILGQGFTLLFRGSKTSDDSVTGSLWILTDAATIVSGSFSGQRK